jgi:hypothetical protein
MNIVITITNRINLPLAFLEIYHTMWDKCAMPRAGTCSLAGRVQMIPMKVSEVLGPVIITSRFLGIG